MPFTDEAPQQPQAKGGFTDGPSSAAPSPAATDSSDSLVSKYAAQYGVPEDFAQRIRGRETGGTPSPQTATSSAGARGIFQLMPGTFKEMGVGGDITNPEQNVHAGIKYLSQMLQRYHGDQTLAAAAYNAGPGAVDAAHGVPHIAETQAYAKATAAPSASRGGFTDSAPKGHFTDESPAPATQPEAAPPAPKGSVPFIDAIGKSGFVQGAEHLAQGIVSGGLTAGTNALSGLNAVLGAPQRAVAASETSGNAGAVLHPNDPRAQSKLEHDIQQPMQIRGEPGGPVLATEQTPGSVASAVGQGVGGTIGKLTDLMVNGLRAIHATGPTGSELVPAAYHQDNEKFLKNLGGTLAAQWITDPTMLPAFVNTLHSAVQAHTVWQSAAEAAERIAPNKVGALKTAVADAKEYHAKVIKPTIGHFLGTRPELDKVLVHDENAPVQGKAARLSIEQKHEDEQALEKVRHDKIMKEHKADIDATKPGTPEEMYKQLPEEVKQEQLREPWRHGTQKMRLDAEARGFHPTAEDHAKFPQPTGAIKYDLRKDYISMMAPKAGKTWKDTELFQTLGKTTADKRRAGFEQHAHPEDKIPDKLSERISNRLAVGRSVVAHRLINNDTKAFLKQHGGWKGQEEVEQKVHDAVEAHADNVRSLKEDAQLLRANPGKYKSMAVKKLQEKYDRAVNHADPEIRADAPDYQAKIDHLQGKSTAANEAYWSQEAAKKEQQASELEKTPPSPSTLRPAITDKHINDLVDNMSFGPVTYRIPFWTQKARQLGRAGIQLNPLPHGVKNVGSLAHLEGGPAAFGAGMAYAVKGLTPEQAAWHHEMGLSIDYLKDAVGPVTAFANKIGAQEMLTRLEMGYRQALKDHYDALYGPSKTIADDYNKAQKIRNALIDYRNVSRFVSLLQAIGGPFVVFRSKLLGTAGKAALRVPGRVESYARVPTDVNEELKKEGEHAEFHPGGPVEDFATAAFKPFDALISPATIGPVASAVMKVFTGKEGPVRAFKQAIGEVIPATNVAGPLLEQIPAFSDFLKHYKLQYDHPGHTGPFNDLMNMAFGSYFGWPEGKSRKAGISAESRGTELPAEPGHYRHE
jgi:hypothetical protein